MKRFSVASLIFCITVFSANRASADGMNLCVYDPGGASGDAYQIIKDYRTAAAGWGVNFTLKPYTDEKTAADDFKAGQCKAVVLTGTRVRKFQKFSGTIEAMGALPTYKHLKMVIKALSKPKAGKLLKSGAYETVGILPGGAVFLLVNDRKINTVEKLAGQRLAVLEHDKAAKVMVAHVGASAVSADMATFAGMFNNGNVAMCYAPAIAYHALELHKGLGKKGGIIRYPLAQVTFQILIRSENFPPEFGNNSRKWAADSFERFKGLATQAENKIPARYWLEIPDDDKARYDQMFQETRIRLRDQGKVYNKTMLKLLRRIRCKVDGTRPECTENKE
jgi:hypothetical protein